MYLAMHLFPTFVDIFQRLREGAPHLATLRVIWVALGLTRAALRRPPQPTASLRRSA
jgi:hypothetical protein